METKKQRMFKSVKNMKNSFFIVEQDGKKNAYKTWAQETNTLLKELKNTNELISLLKISPAKMRNKVLKKILLSTKNIYKLYKIHDSILNKAWEEMMVLKRLKELLEEELEQVKLLEDGQQLFMPV